MPQTIFFGLKEELPGLPIGELGITTDTNEIFIGTETGNRQYVLNQVEDHDGHEGQDEQEEPQDISGMNTGSTYLIELSRWGIVKDGTREAETTKGINDAVAWAKSQGYHHVFLTDGVYKVKIDPMTYTAIALPSNMHFEMAGDCTIELDANSSPSYQIFDIRNASHVKLSGGTIIGDKASHVYEIYVGFERGGVNPDGSLNDDPNWMRSVVLDRYEYPGLLSNFRLWEIPGVVASGYYFYQYKDTVSSDTFVGSRADGGFAPASPTGRGWFLNQDGGITANNKLVFAIDISSQSFTDEEIAGLQAKIDNVYYTHEGGLGIAITGSRHIEIDYVDISNCTGDGILTGINVYFEDPTQYEQDQMGRHIYIHRCNIHHNRRQGISLCGPNDTYVYNNTIHHIGYAADNETTDFRNGTAPMFGIDIESMAASSNIPLKSPEQPGGLELNYRLFITNNHISNNVRGHLVNTDGTNVTVEGNTFEGYNVGGIGSDPRYPYVKYVNNTFIGCELWVRGDNFVNGAVFDRGNLKFNDVRGAVVQNIQVKDGMVYGSSLYGYFGTPAVDVATGTFTYKEPHGMGNGAAVSFESWSGSVPNGISVDQLYYTVNITPASFQVSETKGGKPVAVLDAGQPGFNISRYNYGRCYISNITVERDWRPDNALTRNFSLLGAGTVIKNITVKNYDVSIMVPQNYVGRPITVDGLVLIEGTARFEGCHVGGSRFLRAKSGAMGGNDIQLGSSDNNYSRDVIVQDSYFNHIGITLGGSTSIINSTFLNATIGKTENDRQAIIANSYLEKTKLNLHWISKENSATIAGCIFNSVEIDGKQPFLALKNNTDLSIS